MHVISRSSNSSEKKTHNTKKYDRSCWKGNKIKKNYHDRHQSGQKLLHSGEEIMIKDHKNGEWFQEMAHQQHADQKSYVGEASSGLIRKNRREIMTLYQRPLEWPSWYSENHKQASSPQ